MSSSETINESNWMTAHEISNSFIGTPMLCEILSETGITHLAWQIMFNEEFPGWLYEINLDATTIWER